MFGPGLDANQVVANRDGRDQLTITVEIPVKTVGVDEVRQTADIALLLPLVGVLQRADIDVDILGFKVANCNVLAQDDEIGRANVRSGRIVDRFEVIAQRFQQVMQGGTVSVLAGNLCLVNILNARNEIADK